MKPAKAMKSASTSSSSGTRPWPPAAANSIHMSGPGKFFFTGFNARFIDMPMLKQYMQAMVKMSPLQSYSLEIVGDNPEMRVIGSAVAAETALR